MLIISDKKFRRVLREELERFMDLPQKVPDSYSIKAENGAEIIMPNPTREKFDTNKVNSIGDILHA